MPERATRSKWLRFAAGAALLGSGCGAKTGLDVDAGAPAATSAGSEGGTSLAQGGTTSTTSTQVVFFPVGGRNPTNSASGGTRASPGGGTGGSPNAPLGDAGRACMDEYVTSDAPLRFSGDLSRYSNRYTPSCAPEDGAPDLVYTWWVSSPDTYVVSTLGSSMDTALAAYSGYCGNAELACNDDDSGLSRQSRLVLSFSTRQYVTLVVDGKPGYFALSVDRASALIDVVLSNKLPMRVHGSTLARRDTVTSSCGSRVASNDMTFLFTAPSNGTYEFVVDAKSFSPSLSLRAGGPAGEEITCNLAPLGKNSTLSYAMHAGQSVAVIVDGLLGEAGDFDLVVTENKADLGGCCDSSMQRAGCIDEAIMQCVCKRRRDCCYYFWDPSCVEAVILSGCGTCPTSGI